MWLRLIFVFAVCGLLSVGSRATAQDWTRFRGPNGSGVSDAATVPTTWTKADYNWVAELPGEGNSSPVVWGKHLYTTAADAESGRRFLVCLNTDDGATLWKRDVAFRGYKKHKNNSYASNTPAVDADHVYALWQSPEQSPLIAFDHSGARVWEYDLGPYRHGQGGGTSPIVYGDLVIVSNDHAQGSFLVAVDRRTGAERWKIGRQGKRACYSTPCVYQPEGHDAEIIFTHCFEGVIGVDPKSGRQLWMVDVFGRFPQRAVGSPVVYRDLVIGSSGAAVADKNVVAIRPKTSGAEAQEVWRVTRAAPHVPSPLVYGDRVFLWNDAGIVTCLSAGDGKKIWQNRVGGAYFGSPICVNGRLYCVDLDGTVVVVSASDKFEVLGRNPLGEQSRSTPAVSDGVLYVRTLLARVFDRRQEANVAPTLRVGFATRSVQCSPHSPSGVRHTECGV